MIVVFLGIIAVTEVVLFIKVMVDFVLALHFRKQDKRHQATLDKTLELLAYRIAELNKRVAKLEYKKEE